MINGFEALDGGRFPRLLGVPLLMTLGAVGRSRVCDGKHGLVDGEIVQFVTDIRGAGCS